MNIKDILFMFIISWMWIFSLPLLLFTSIIWIPVGTICFVVSFIASFFIQIYLKDIVIHKSPLRTFITNLKLYLWFYTKPVTVPKKHIILAHPHGILCCGVISMIHFVKKSNTVIAVAPILFYIPIFGWVLRYMGAIPATYTCIKKAVKKKSVILVLDGIAGIVGMENKSLYIEKRYGAFKIAKETDTPILPIWVHNEYKTFDIIKLPYINIRKKISENIGFPLMFPCILGWYGTWMPKRVRLTILKGKIISPRQHSIKQMKNLHAQSIESLSKQVHALERWEEDDNHRE